MKYPSSTEDQSESKIQRALVTWARWKTTDEQPVPFDRLFAIPNGVKISGPRHAASQLGLGTTRGIPDLMFPYPGPEHAGLWLEMKKDSGRVRPEQVEWTEWLQSVGYKTAICFTLLASVEALLNYGVIAHVYQQERPMSTKSRQTRKHIRREQLEAIRKELADGQPIECAKILQVVDPKDWPMEGVTLTEEGLVAALELHEFHPGVRLLVNGHRIELGHSAHTDRSFRAFGYVMSIQTEGVYA